MNTTCVFWKTSVLYVLTVLFVGCGSPIEDRFDHSFFDGGISIEKCQIVLRKSNRSLNFSGEEINKLQLDIGKVNAMYVSVDDLVRIAKDNPLDVSIVFSDGFECKIDGSLGRINQVLMLVLYCPESGGFQGAVRKIVRLEKVFSLERLKELGLQLDLENEAESETIRKKTESSKRKTSN